MTGIMVAPLFGNAAISLLLVVPLLTMRLISDEGCNQTLSLLLSAPLSMAEIVMGKFLAVVIFLVVLLFLIMLMPLSLLAGGALDFGVLVSGALGLALILFSFTALGLYMSSLTTQPTIAAISSFGVLLLLWVLDWGGSSADVSAGAGIMGYLSLVRHYEALLKGVFNSADIVYYLLFIVTFLVLGIRRLGADRLQS